MRHCIKVLVAVVALTALTQATSAQTGESLVQPAGVETLSTEALVEIADAESNRSRVVTRPRQTSSPEWVYPDSERALGHHGRVIIRGLIGADGRVRFATIRESSGAPVLDQLALTWASNSVFEPAKDANSEPLATMAVIPTEFYSFTAPWGIGTARYTCRQFVLDMDWWRSTFPERALSDHYYFTLVLGLGVISRLQLGPERAFGAESNEAFAGRWMQAIESCRADPDARFADMIHPEGDIILGIGRDHQRRSR